MCGLEHPVRDLTACKHAGCAFGVARGFEGLASTEGPTERNRFDAEPAEPSRPGSAAGSLASGSADIRSESMVSSTWPRVRMRRRGSRRCGSSRALACAPNACLRQATRISCRASSIPGANDPGRASRGCDITATRPRGIASNRRSLRGDSPRETIGGGPVGPSNQVLSSLDVPPDRESNPPAVLKAAEYRPQLAAALRSGAATRDFRGSFERRTRP